VSGGLVTGGFASRRACGRRACVLHSHYVPLADLGFFRGGDFGNPSERRERALRGSGITGERNLSVYELGRGHDEIRCRARGGGD